MMTGEQLDRAAASLRAGDYNLLLGAAASLGSTNGDGGELPLADAFRLELCSLKSAKTSHSLQRVFQTLDADEVQKHVTERFLNCAPGPALRAIPTFLWRRIFTLNIDDALEAAYGAGDPYQIAEPKNFRDPYEDTKERSRVPIIHLHGYTQRPDDGYVFSRDAYLNVIKTANPWMVVLSQLMATEPFIIMGSSLDEVDLDYFLSLRSQSTARADRGPSILVEPFGDIITDRECERLDLLRFPGTAEQFIDYLNANVRNRPRPRDLVPPEARDIFVEELSPHDISAFYSDFELVPPAAAATAHDPRFFFGHAPSWSDLTQQYDIARPINSTLSKYINDAFSGAEQSKIVFLSDHVGVGKTTSLRRVGFDFARQGHIVLSCSAASRLEPRFTADILSKVAGRCLVLVDDFADQVHSVESILTLAQKEDLVFLAAERTYRHRFVSEALAGTKFRSERSSKLSAREAVQLIDTYVAAGLVGDESFIRDRDEAVASIINDPIAVACCRIMNDLRPLDRIVDSLLKEANQIDRTRYLTAALAEYCTKSGVRAELLIAAVSGAGISQQFNAAHRLPLTYSEETGRNYVVPLNGTLGTRILDVVSERHPEELLKVFENLARVIAPRVNRKTIVQRTPEARLAARLFDLDQVVERLLRDRAEAFYEAIEDEWRWNSRYWEQVALLNLYKSQSFEKGSSGARSSLDLAVAHARHAVSIERHPLTLTTLAKILFSEATATGSSTDALIREAIGSLNEAIIMEHRRNRVSVHPYVVLFQGVRSLPSLTPLMDSELATIRTSLRDAKGKFPRDPEVQSLVNELEHRLAT